ncbi:MAG: chromosomal replication initiator protein DnaA [Akkermansia sp.]|nr:chromosomal replication initiator protein DnaA [Akkermansia sp.]
MATTADMNAIWEQILEDLRTRCGVSADTMETIFSQLSLTADNGTVLTLTYPAEMMIEWVEINYGDVLTMATSRVLQAARRIEFIEEGSAPEQAEPAVPEQAENRPSAAKARRQAAPRRKKPLNSGLNTDYSFDSFIVGSSNNFAYAAATTVARHAGELYNPLFIHGESGLGKTHLLQAIGNAIREEDDNTQVLYLTSETFVNDYIDALSRRGDALNAFRRKYRRADVLLIDDVQFLARAGRTQEEFFHTFNALFESGKQIVLSADCPAGNITNMDERLISRFEQGLTVSILPPDYETRVAILRKKLKQWKSDLISPEVVDFLAKNITHSVRALEGALVRLTTFATFCRRRLSVADARAQLGDLLRQKRGESISIEVIQQRVAEEFKVKVSDINGRRRTAAIAHPRQIAMYLARKHTERSLQDVGAAFGGRDHGTVLHAERTIEAKMAEDAELRDCISRLSAALA